MISTVTTSDGSNRDHTASDPPRGGGPASMGHNEELHESVIDVPRGSRLDNEDILVSN